MMFRQMLKSLLRQMFHVRVASHTEMIQSSGWSKLHYEYNYDDT